MRNDPFEKRRTEGTPFGCPAIARPQAGRILLGSGVPLSLYHTQPTEIKNNWTSKVILQSWETGLAACRLEGRREVFPSVTRS
jgi:hypothetical protein